MKGVKSMPQSDLLLEHILHHRSPWAIRFYQDGRVDEYSDQTVRFENDQIVTHEQPPEWRPLTHLSVDELDALKDAIRQSGILALPKQVGNPEQVMDGAVAEWYARLGERENRLSAWEPQASEHPGLKELSVAIQTITASAFNRDS
jgi:hypothetical protein